MPFSRTWFHSFLFISACSQSAPSCLLVRALFLCFQFKLKIYFAASTSSSSSLYFFLFHKSVFFHFRAVLMPLAPLFPFPAKEHVVFIFYADGIRCRRCFVLLVWQSVVACKRALVSVCVCVVRCACCCCCFLQMLFVFFASTLLLKAPLQYIK